jgi:hypothetical protein
MGNLPAQPYGELVGRDDVVSEALNILRDPGGAPCVVLTGIGGIGKTAIAYEVARRAAQAGLFQDVLWESAKQYELLGAQLVTLPDAGVTKEALLNSLARQLGRYEMLQLRIEERRLRLQYLLQHNPYLIVVDNLESVEDNQAVVDELATMLGPSRAIFTSRITPDMGEHGQAIPVKGLSESTALDFLRREAAAAGVAALAGAEQGLLRRVAVVTGAMPLAMKFVIAQIRAGVPTEAELQRLASADNEVMLYRYIYFDLWSTLSIPSQKILVAIPAFAASVPRFLLQPVARVADGEFESAAGDLVRKSLVEQVDNVEPAKRRYSVHQLTRHFVNSDLRAAWEAQKAAA